MKALLLSEKVEVQKSLRSNLIGMFISFVTLVVYAVVGWNVMMAFYGSATVMFMSLLLVLPFIPCLLYFIFGISLLILTWMFMMKAGEAKQKMNSLEFQSQFIK